MKRMLMWLLLFTLVITTTGCGAKKKMEQKVTEKFAEKIIEKATDNKVDIQGDKVIFKDESGQQVTIGSTQWPKSDLAKSIPEFKDGTITTVMDSPDYIMITMEKVKQNDFSNYLEAIKKDFTKGAYEMTAEDISSYGAGNDKGVGIQISYESEDKVLTIGVVKSE